MRGYPNNTINIPPKNALLPFALCHWKKNLEIKTMLKKKTEKLRYENFRYKID